ncbi:MAG: HD domain-containing protein [Candidatus Omnitrophica bacterium]|nr:HD domain-containing protein [Candidatus Omnitrophota bacterium]
MAGDKALLEFIAEAGILKRIRRSGWWVLGIDNPESVAEHSFRCAVLGYTIAKMERVSPYKVFMMTLFGDIHEARINDSHKMAQRYLDYETTENKAFFEQIGALPKAIKGELSGLHKEYRAQKSKESIIARDADILECLIQAKEYYEFGFKQASKFMKKAPNFLKTKTSRKLWQSAKKMSLNEWWMKLSDFKR